MLHSAAAAARLGRSPFAGAPSSPVTATASVSKGGGYIVPLRPSGSSAWLWQQQVPAYARWSFPGMFSRKRSGYLSLPGLLILVTPSATAA